MLPFTLAQVSDPISGGAGWVGAGLLGLVLAWLMLKHLPDKDKQLDKIIGDHLKAEADQRKEYAALEKEQRAEFRQSLETIVDHNNRTMDGLAQALRDDLEELRKMMETTVERLRK